MTIFVDLDGVICTEEKTFERSLARLIPGAREGMRALVDAGHTVVIYSARSWAELEMTKRWLDDHEIPYDGIQLGKPIGEKHLDDRAVAFTGDWGKALQELSVTSAVPGGVTDEGLLRILREATVSFLQEISARDDLLEPILEVGPMVREGASAGVFTRMPELFLDSKRLFAERKLRYLSLDVDANSNPDVVGDLADAARLIEHGSLGTIILLSCLEHMPRLWDVPLVLDTLLIPGGRAFMLTPWNLRFHGPRPDCWRISDDGYEALFGERFEIESINRIETPGRPLSPVGLTCVVRKPA